MSGEPLNPTFDVHDLATKKGKKNFDVQEIYSCFYNCFRLMYSV